MTEVFLNFPEHRVMVPKPRKPVIDDDRLNNYHTAHYLDIVWLNVVEFNAPENVNATKVASNELVRFGVDYFQEAFMEGSAKSDRWKNICATKVLVMSYFNAIVQVLI